MKVRKPQLLHYDAILFDVDGTLIDSAPGILQREGCCPVSITFSSTPRE